MKVLKAYLGLLLYFLFFLLLCIAIDYLDNKVLFDSLMHYYFIILGALAYHAFTYLSVANAKIDNDTIHVNYIPKFNRNKSIAISDIEEIRIFYSYNAVNFTFYLNNFKKVKFSSMNQTYKNDIEFKQYFENSNEFKTHKYLGRWKARKI